MSALLATTGLTKRFGGLLANDAINLHVPRGGLHAIIGPNGAGKTTLIGQLSGQLRPDSGRIHFAGEDITHLPAHARARRGFGRSFQITNVVAEMTARDNVALAVQAQDGHSFRFWRSARLEKRLREPALAILARLQLDHRADVIASQLSHGEKRVLEIGMALAGRPQLLLLDEPLAGTGPEESARIVRLLTAIKGETTILLIEHDMDAVFALADTVSVLVYGRIIATGTPSDIRRNAEVQKAYLGDEESR